MSFNICQNVAVAKHVAQKPRPPTFESYGRACKTVAKYDTTPHDRLSMIALSLYMSARAGAAEKPSCPWTAQERQD
ncbi:hypothetical protein RRU01S_14_02520 [Agrobacterium rubi TR3 = NBRC 13261]|uniref:Uncharacterized protein n=1 Tax=Agrobacterium rubi TR3 = NBRC 13261 TaxID=1368415 RepID=A0A081CWI2_9HYPH|nr:hypothetical protein RRU01S_14_02520 [Agrobacterium rubi TR3 = NBRC 13261]